MKNLLESFTNIDEVESIALGGSTGAKTSDNISDIDIYVFSKNGVPIKYRENIIKQVSSKFDIGEEYFGSGDEFLFDKENIILDMMYWDMKWFGDVVDNVWQKHYAANGYTTCFLYTLNNFKIIYDKNGWLKNLQNKLKTNYPAELKNNIINRNLMLIKDKPFASYYEQIEKAIYRNDINSINHRVSALLASYFDIIFAMNELLHPGEKRLVQYAKDNCKVLPDDFEENIEKLLTQSQDNILNVLEEMIRNLRKCL